MKRIVLASLLALSCLLPAQAKAADEIVVNGSTTVLPIMQKVSEAYMAANPNVQIALSGGGSGNGIKALLDGLANIAMSSRDIKGSEKARAAKKGINPVRTAVAVDALVPVVNPKNPINELSLDQLKDIYLALIHISEPTRHRQDHQLEGTGRRRRQHRGRVPRHVLRHLRNVGRNGHEEGQGHAQGPASGFQRRG